MSHRAQLKVTINHKTGYPKIIFVTPLPLGNAQLGWHSQITVFQAILGNVVLKALP